MTLRALRPARPSPVLFERIEEAMAENCRASVSDAGYMAKWPWRFTKWSRGDASDIDGQLVRARERERASQTPYRIGFALAAAAVLLLFAAISVERQRQEGKEIARSFTCVRDRTGPACFFSWQQRRRIDVLE